MTLSVVIVCQDEEHNIARTLDSVRWADEVILVDSGSTDRTLEIAATYPNVRIFREPWKGFAGQKNSGMEKATGDWVLWIDADEPLEPALQEEMRTALATDPGVNGFWIPRKNYFMNRWMRFGGQFPDRKLHLIRRGSGKWEGGGAHPGVKITGASRPMKHAILHYAYPTLRSYLEHMNSYSSSQAQYMAQTGRRGFHFVHIVISPLATFLYNYVVRLGFLDGREGFLLHAYHSAYVSQKYAKLWELTRDKR